MIDATAELLSAVFATPDKQLQWFANLSTTWDWVP